MGHAAAAFVQLYPAWGWVGWMLLVLLLILRLAALVQAQTAPDLMLAFSLLRKRQLTTAQLLAT